MTPNDPRPDLSLLLVHGIGRHVPGSVVGPIANALERWLRTHPLQAGRRVEVERALLKPAQRGDPGRARVTLVIHGTDGSPDRRILLVESLWAEEFDPPGFLGVLRWTLGPGAWLLFRHIVGVPTRLARWVPAEAREGYLFISAGVFGVIALFLAVIPLQLIGIALALLWLVPIAQVRSAVGAVVRVMSEIVGDSYLFARDPVVRRALADRVRSDLHDIRCAGAPVVVLAHSQGAAVSLAMLERHDDPPPLVTYGAGIRKLHELADDHGASFIPRLAYGLWIVAGGVVVALAGAVVNVQSVLGGNLEPSQTAGLAWFALLMAYLAAFVLGGLAQERTHDLDVAVTRRIRPLLTRQRAWLDLYATHDPVPAGPLVVDEGARTSPDDALAPPPAVDSREITNERQWLGDHTSYWNNPDGFIEPVMSWVAKVHGLTWMPEAGAATPAWRNRAARVWLRSTLNTMLRVEVLVLCWFAWSAWTSVLPTADVVAGFVSGAEPRGVAAWAGAAAAKSYGFLALLAGLAVHFGALAAYDALCIRPAWRALDRRVAWSRPATPAAWIAPVLWLIVAVSASAVASILMALAIANRSYEPLYRAPMDLLYDSHRTFVAGPSVPR